MTHSPPLRTRLRLWRVQAVRSARRLVPSESQRLFVMTLLIGGACGLAAVGFHFAISLAESLLIDRALAAPGRSWMAWSIASPVMGGLVGGVVLQYVVPGARGSGIPQVKAVYASKDPVVPIRDAVGKFFLGSFQIGSGGSLGREGPTVQICAGIASFLGRLAPISAQGRRRLLPVGAAAGIAAAFNAPIAAVTFTIEEVVGKLDQTVLSGVIVAAALAAVIERSALGAHPIFDLPQHYGAGDARSLLLFAALGVAAAGVAITFTDGLLTMRKRFRGSAVPPWAQPAVGGAVTGALIVAAMYFLRSGGINGGGYEVVKRALSGELTVRVMLALCAMKLVATVFSYSSGGAGGIFAPSLFMGAMLGGAFGSLDRTLFGHTMASSMGAFALVGMGAVFSATIRAPITSVLIIVEMTSGYSLILPLMIANMSAYVLARHWRPAPIYEALLAQDGIHLGNRAVVDPLEALRLEEVIRRRDDSFVSFEPATPASALLHLTEGNDRQAAFPVLDASEKLVGVIYGEDLAVLRAEPDLELLVNASDLMRPPIAVRSDEDLRSAFELLRDERLHEVPVQGPDGRVIGFIDAVSVVEAFLRASAPSSTGELTSQQAAGRP
jgi:CIC family chloride channel protein